MANELQSLTQLFQNRYFRIPDYQRGYAWKESQLIDFWNDLINLHPDRFHYTGLISFKSLKEEETIGWEDDTWLTKKGYKPSHIVDGQQRLTTAIILINELINCAKNISNDSILGFDDLESAKIKFICQDKPPHKMVKTYLFGYESDNPSSDYLKYSIFNEDHSITLTETYYTKNLKFAKNFFKENLLSYLNEFGTSGLSDLYAKLTLRFMFNIHEIDDDYDVFVAFETMNNRGKKLTNLELLKNRMIYLSTLYNPEHFDESDKIILRRKINDAWKEVYFQLGRNGTIPLDDDEFLRAHWIIYYTYSRKKGDDYIRFLLRKFSSSNVFEHTGIKLNIDDDSNNPPTESLEYTDSMVDDTSDISSLSSKLNPSEINNYVNSLKDLAKHWYASFFPSEEKSLTNQEIEWIDKLNRIGIGYFRPLVAVIISKQNIDVDLKILCFKKIERFIFTHFRMGFNVSNSKSSDFYRLTHLFYEDEYSIEHLIDYIEKETNENLEFNIPAFVNRVEKMFVNGKGFYDWNSLRYFLFEYELTLSEKYNISKIKWQHFTKSEKDKVSIEHILPQTPTDYYWQNQFRQFNSDEIRILGGAIGNLVPLSQSINSSLQNIAYPLKRKTSPLRGGRGYDNGSHSEIEISKNENWSAIEIYNRSYQLILFLTARWNISLTESEINSLIYLDFTKDGREIPNEIDEKIGVIDDFVSSKQTPSKLGDLQVDFWNRFINYAKSKDRNDIVSQKGLKQNWYTVRVGTSDFQLHYTITHGDTLSLTIYTNGLDVFNRLFSKKETIEHYFGDQLEWNTSREKSRDKRILYRRKADLFDISSEYDYFEWMIIKLDQLKIALEKAGEIQL